MKMKNSSRCGFNLLELSIVLVVIALILGGIIVGNSMIRSASISATISELQKYQTAIIIFKNKYRKLPGDLNNASSYWPDCNAPCNGTGNGAIDGSLAWHHLSLSKIIPENYPKLNAPPLIKADIPEASISYAGWGLTNSAPYGKARNYLILNQPMQENTIKGPLTSVEAIAFDTKIDDATPSKGKTFAINHMNNDSDWDTAGCVNGGNLLSIPSAIDWDYSNNSEENCILTISLHVN